MIFALGSEDFYFRYIWRVLILSISIKPKMISDSMCRSIVTRHGDLDNEVGPDCSPVILWYSMEESCNNIPRGSCSKAGLSRNRYRLPTKALLRTPRWRRCSSVLRHQS